MIKRIIKSHLSKVKFGAYLNPKIKTINNYRKFIPEPYKSVLLISADFELAWAWRFTKSATNPLEKALLKAKLERKNIPLIVKLCEKYNIPITWLTVGHLFLESCERLNGKAHPELPGLGHFENDFWKYNNKDWFEHDPCSDYKVSPEWYGPDLIHMILNSKVKHEIGCHTFSHIDCRDEVCPPELLQAELKECIKNANELGIELKSFVHPGHTIGNLDVIAEEGFTNFRTDYENVLGYPKKHKNGLWEFEQTAGIVYRKDWSVDYHIYRYITIIKRAIKTNTVCVLWFHPSFDLVVLEKILPDVFRFIYENKDKIKVTTNRKYLEWLKTQSITNHLLNNV